MNDELMPVTPTYQSILFNILQEEMIPLIQDTNSHVILEVVVESISDWRFKKRFWLIQDFNNILELYGNIRGHNRIGSELFCLLTQILQQWYINSKDNNLGDYPNIKSFIHYQAAYYKDILNVYRVKPLNMIVDDTAMYDGYDSDIDWYEILIAHPAILVIIAIHYLPAGDVLSLLQQIVQVINGEDTNEQQDG